MGQSGGRPRGERRRGMKIEEYQERKVAVDGWELNLTSYRLGS